MLRKFGSHLRDQWMGALSLFLVLAGGTAYAAATIDSGDVVNESLRSSDIKNGQVRNPDLGFGAVQGQNLAEASVGNDAIGEGAVGSDEVALDALGSSDVAGLTGDDISGLTGEDIDESSLDPSPLIAAESAAIDACTWVVRDWLPCDGLTVNLERASRIVFTVDAEWWWSGTGSSTVIGECSVKSNPEGFSFTGPRVGQNRYTGEDQTWTRIEGPYAPVSFTSTTGVLGPGPIELELHCVDVQGDLGWVSPAQMTALVIAE